MVLLKFYFVGSCLALIFRFKEIYRRFKKGIVIPTVVSGLFLFLMSWFSVFVIVKNDLKKGA